jgi:hypothetical protein
MIKVFEEVVSACFKFASRLIRQKRFGDIIVLVALTFLVYRNWFTHGVIQYGDWNYFFNEPLLDFLSGLTLLDRYVGYSMRVSASTGLAAWPIWFMNGFLANILRTDFSLTERVFFFYPLPFLAVFSMYYLSYVIFHGRISCFFSSLVYALNCYMMFWAEGGGATIAFAGALIPLVLAFFVKSLERWSLKNCVATGFILAILASYELRIAYITFGITVSYLIFDLLIKITRVRKKFGTILGQLPKSFGVLAITLCIFVVLHAFWILPAFMFSGVAVPSGNNQPFWVPTLSINSIMDSLVLYHRWTLYINPERTMLPVLFAVPILAFFPILYRRKPIVIYLSLLFLVCNFFATGTKAPFGGELYLWLFLNFPGFSAFREPTKFLFGATLACALLFGVATEIIVNKLAQFHMFGRIDKKRKNWKVPKVSYSKILQGIALFLITLLLLSTSWATLVCRPYGTFNTHQIPNEYFQIRDWLKPQPDYFRTLWFPYHPDYFMNDQWHPAIYPYLGFPAFGYYFLFQEFFQNRTNYLGKIYGLASVKYIIISPESTWKVHGFHSVDPYENILDHQSGLEKFRLFNNITIYENKFVIPRFYATQNGILVVGGKAVLLKLSPYLNFSNQALFFVDQLQKEALSIWDQIDVVIFDNGKSIDDLILALVGDEYRVNLFKYAKLYGYDDKNCWLRNFPGFDGYSIQYDGRGSFFEDRMGEIRESPQMVRAPTDPLDYSNPDAKMEFSIRIEKSGIYDLWLRMGLGPDYGRLSLLIDNAPFEVDFSSVKYHSLKWLKLNTLFLDQGLHKISLINRVGKNSLDDLVVIPHDVFLSLKADILAHLSDKRVVFFNSNQSTQSLSDLFMSNASGSIRWTRINPSRYQLDANIDVPFFLVFSDAYDSHWVLKDSGDKRSKSIVSWGGLNAFLVNSEGPLILEFPPQQYVEIGSFISVSSMFLIVLYLVIPIILYKKVSFRLLRKRNSCN